MTSPFADFANATIVFQVGTGQFITDPVTLNPVEVKQDLTCTALLNPLDSRLGTDIKFYEGADESWQLLEGFWVDPLPPPDIAPGAVGKITLTSDVGITRTGSFRYFPRVNDPFVTSLGIDFISKLRGLFRETNFTLPGES